MTSPAWTVRREAQKLTIEIDLKYAEGNWSESRDGIAEFAREVTAKFLMEHLPAS
jgi:hypothetical protein